MGRWNDRPAQAIFRHGCDRVEPSTPNLTSCRGATTCLDADTARLAPFPQPRNHLIGWNFIPTGISVAMVEVAATVPPIGPGWSPLPTPQRDPNLPRVTRCSWGNCRLGTELCEPSVIFVVEFHVLHVATANRWQHKVTEPLQ